MGRLWAYYVPTACPQLVISDNTAGKSLFTLNFKWSEVVYMTALLKIVQRLTIVDVILEG